MVRESFEELQKAIYAADEEPEEEIDELPPHHTSDFTCIRWCFLRLDLIPWYTSGFK